MSCAHEIGRACAERGFFYITGHGIPEERRLRLFEAAHAFFDLPLREKERLSLRRNDQYRGYTAMRGEITAGERDWHECLDIQPLTSRLAETDGRCGAHVLDDPGQWPNGLTQFAEAVTAAWDDRVSIAWRLVEGLALSLGLPDEYFHKFHGLDLCDLRLSHYPAVPEAPADGSALGMNAHVDLGFLAIIDQDSVGGLEVLGDDGAWRDAPPLPGAYLVNIGLMMQRWTNDRYRATWHRVRLSREGSRYAAPFFYEPRPSAVVAPLPECCGPDDPPRYPSCTVGDYFERAFTSAYRSPLEERR